MKVIFSHGKESGPWGTKIKYLAEIAKALACEVESIDYRGVSDADERVRQLIERLHTEIDDYLLVGSSMGGYVSLVAASQLKAKGVFLLAPALYMPGYENKDYALKQDNVSIVHAWGDDIIPWENALQYAKQTQCELHLLNSDHRLISVLDAIGDIFKSYLLNILNENPIKK